MKKQINIVSFLILMSANQMLTMDRHFAQGGGAAAAPSDQLYPDDFAEFVVQRFTFDGVEDFQQLLPALADLYSQRFRQLRQLGLPTKQEVGKWIDELVAQRKPQAVDVELTPEEAKPVDLVCAAAKSPYFVNRSTLARMQERGDALHPEVRCKFTVLDMPKSWAYWVDKGRVTQQEWLDKLQEGDALTYHEFNLEGIDDLVQSADDKELAQAIALSLQQPNTALSASSHSALIPAVTAEVNESEDQDSLAQGIEYIYDFIPDLG